MRCERWCIQPFPNTKPSSSSRCVTEITSEIVVYRISLPRILEYLQAKVVRLATSEVLEISRTTIRGLAKDGLMEDGKETLLQGKLHSIKEDLLVNIAKVGRMRAACDLLAQYLSPDIHALLVKSYEYALISISWNPINPHVLVSMSSTRISKLLRTRWQRQL